MSITIIKVENTNEDGRLIMKWRNDPIMRSMSYNSELKEWTTFKTFFKEKYFANYVPPLFACLNERKIAFIGFVGNAKADVDTNDKICKICINISPEYRGKKLGKKIINKAIDFIKTYYPLVKTIIAEIKPNNIPSIKLFESCNFKFIKKKQWNNIGMLVYNYTITHILILAAHPDDEILGCGGTINRLANEKSLITLLTFTNGESSRDNDKDRRNLLDKVCKTIGINKYIAGDFPDNQMDSVPLLELCKFIETNINFEPDIIFTHHRNCNNIDHQLVYRATITAFRPQEGNAIKILSYYIPSSTDYNPFNEFRGNIYYDIEDTIGAKLECLRFYDDEMREHPHSRSYENVENLAKVWGAEVGLKYAEKFELVREIN